MPASFTTYKMWGTLLVSSVAFTSETNIGTHNNNDPAANMSIGVPDSGVNYTYELPVKVKCVGMGGSALINNFRMWYQNSTTGQPGGQNFPATGVYLYGGTSKAYFTPTINQSTKATWLMTNYNSIGNSLLVGGQVTAVNSAFNFMVLQLRVAPTADYNAVETPIVMHWAYDEA
jgi:hypothetical protein